MNREIKFRALYHDNKIYEARAINIETKEALINVGDGFEWISVKQFIQYTGLKDKNGVEIYEGDIITLDIIKPNINLKKINGFIKWVEKEAAFSIERIDYKEELYFSVWQSLDCEVIGNIYENPELVSHER